MSAEGTDEPAPLQELERLRRRVSELESRERELSATQAGLNTGALRQRALLDALPDMVFRIVARRHVPGLSPLPQAAPSWRPSASSGPTWTICRSRPRRAGGRMRRWRKRSPAGRRRHSAMPSRSLTGSAITRPASRRSGADELVVTVRDVTQQHHAEREIARRSEREHLIARMSQRFLRYNPEQLDAEIESALAALGEFVAADRSYLFLVSADGRRISNTHEWCAPEVAPQIQALQDLSLEEIGWAWRDLSRGEVLHVPSVAALPVEAQPVRALLEMQEIRSLVLVPLFLDGRVCGLPRPGPRAHGAALVGRGCRPAAHRRRHHRQRHPASGHRAANCAPRNRSSSACSPRRRT
ncbi:MAG: GAF domain-containing protein [Comamonadaceae bacterium]|nr:GAF domain-containing protein [Comamonadaceae bacterium]